ncbi:uncharacterized protein EHS24_001455 [Apiotrichum porosum]|uniref:STM1-like N-terminal domain-containing protein n=1 Tax=Apiotrichum porosum TaxID=105984 RepID=A0A427XKJ0_9TREE|nr:uncharacterized protein EHS24_001455 [Apiotrichum porosum]RSH79409.1 hypothetical protein EHS24_001455 [Apiotrichum porosum]
MSVVSKNPFELLGNDGERAASPAPKAVAAAAPAAAAAAPKAVPGAAPKGGRGARYPARGGPRNVYREDRPATEGAEGFDGERVAPPRKHHEGRDRHTKGPKDEKAGTGPRSRAPGAARGPKISGTRGAKGGAAPIADKKPAAETYDNAEGKAELTAENDGEKDAAAPETPAVDAEEQEIEEDNSKTLDQYLAEKAEKALGGVLAKKEARVVTADDVEGTAFARSEGESFFSGKKTEEKQKASKAKKEKIFLEVDFQSARPERTDRAPRGEKPVRGRGGNASRGAGARGAARGAARAPRQAPAAINDEKAFPSLA